MSERSGAREGGFTLVEIVIAVAIVATTVAAGFGISLASRSLAVSTAAGEFDHFLDSARTMARDLDGVTLAFTADAYGDGTEVRLLAGGPNAPPSATTLPTLHARATIEELESLGKVPFAFIVHASGALSGRPGYRVGDTTTTDVGCPASGAFHFVIKAAGGRADRFVPCRTKLAANGPVSLTSWPLAPTAPSPTPCSGPGCTPATLPGVPLSTASCPPNFAPVPGGCTPAAAPPSSGAHYHVTTSGAPPTLDVGATASFSAQATLTNPNAVAAGTPASIPVSAQTADATCSPTPAGWQQSGSTFNVTAISPGTCTVTVGADTSAVPGATADTGTVSVTIPAAPSAAPKANASSCDLVENGKCYSRIVDLTTRKFNKTVSAESNCGNVPPDTQCTYLDSIRGIWLDEFFVIPPTPPIDESHQLLFRINNLQDVGYACMPYSTLSTYVPTDTLPLAYREASGPVDPPLGFGNPSEFATVNHLFVGNIPSSFDERAETARVVPKLYDMVDAIERRKPGLPFSFTYYSASAIGKSAIAWLPDFPSCDNAGDPSSAGTEYGNVSLDLTFEIFQATP